MKENRLTVRIKKPALEVFRFTINPQNTPQWIDSLVGENINTPEVGVGTTYTNINEKGERGEYVVSQFELGKIFTLDSLTSTYHVKYTCTPISESETELEYFEWVDDGELQEPLGQETLNKLKSLLEAK